MRFLRPARRLRAKLLYQDGPSGAFIPRQSFFHDRRIIFAARYVLSWWGHRAGRPRQPHEQV